MKSNQLNGCVLGGRCSAKTNSLMIRGGRYSSRRCRRLAIAPRQANTGGMKLDFFFIDKGPSTAKILGEAPKPTKSDKSHQDQIAMSITRKLGIFIGFELLPYFPWYIYGMFTAILEWRCLRQVPTRDGVSLVPDPSCPEVPLSSIPTCP